MPSGENWIWTFCALLVVRPRDRADDLVLLEVVLHQRRRADLEAVDQLGGRRGEQHHEAVQRIGLDAPDPDLLLPSLSVKVSTVDRVAMSMISIFSIPASMV